MLCTASGQREYGNVIVSITVTTYIQYFTLRRDPPEVPIETGQPANRMLPQFPCAVPTSVQTLLRENSLR